MPLTKTIFKCGHECLQCAKEDAARAQDNLTHLLQVMDGSAPPTLTELRSKKRGPDLKPRRGTGGNPAARAKLSPDVVAQIEHMMAAGQEASDVAKALKVSRGAVWKYAHKAKARTSNGHTPAQTQTADHARLGEIAAEHARLAEIAALVARYRNGEQIKDLAAESGIPVKTLYNFTAKKGQKKLNGLLHQAQA